MVDDNPVTIAGIASSLNEVVVEVKKKPLMSQVANSNLPSQLPKDLEINMRKSNQLKTQGFVAAARETASITF